MVHDRKDQGETSEVSQRTAAVDFDGVLHKFSKYWHDGTIYDPPFAGAAGGMRRLKEAGYTLIIHSCRTLAHQRGSQSEAQVVSPRTCELSGFATTSQGERLGFAVRCFIGAVR